MTSAPTSETPVLFFGKDVARCRRPALSGEARPLLSICIPTYNRAQRLRSLLHSLAGQCAALLPEVEILVSDNASPDETRAVVQSFESVFPVVYSRNHQNEGACRNLQILASTLARGHFCWLIGDDDLVREGGVARVLGILRDNPEVDFLFANTSTRLSQDYEARKKDGLVHSADFPLEGPVKARKPGPSRPCAFEELIDPEVDDVNLGSLMCGVFRTEVWRLHNKEIIPRDGSFGSLENSYPHAMVHALTQVGRRAYYLAEPVSIAFWGGQEWTAGVPRLLLFRQQELLSLYEQQGVPSWRVNRCRKALVGISGESLARLLVDPSVPGHEHFDLGAYLRVNKTCAALVFEQLDQIVAFAQARRIDTRPLQQARALLALYPRRRPPANPAAATPDVERFKACIQRVPDLVGRGKVQEAVDALHQARALAPNAECTTLVLNYFAMFIRNKILAVPSDAFPGGAKP